MNTSAVESGYRPGHEGTSLKIMTGSAVLEGIGGIAVIALAIVGLAGVFSASMAAIATIVLGAAVLFEGGAFAATHTSERGDLYSETRIEQSGGVGAEFLGATAGIILGILALLGAAPMVLISVAVLVFGATFACSALTSVASSYRGVYGLAGFVLGLLAVCGLGSITLVLVALLCLGSSTLFGGARTGAAVASATH